MEAPYASVSIGRQLLFHPRPNCTPPAIDQFPSGLFTLEQRLQGALLVHVVTALYVLCVLGVLSHEYFVPAMEKLVTVTKIDPDVAGTAVMATAASTPQLATAIIGVFVAKSDIGLGAVVGASYFNIFFILGLCGLASKEALQLDWWPVLRDVFFYILSAAILAVLLIDEKATWWDGLILVLFYVLYVVVLIFNSQIEHAVTMLVSSCRLGYSRCKCRTCREDMFQEGDAKCDNCDLPNTKRMSSRSLGSLPASSISSDLSQNKDGAAASRFSSPSQIKKGEEKDAMSEEQALETTPKSYESFPREDNEPAEYRSILHIPDKLWKKIIWALLMPALLVTYISIPDCRRPGSWKYMFVFTIIMSVIVIGCCAYVLIWMFAIIGSTMGIPDTVMGLTFLAAGGSLPDLMNAVLVARHGYGDMAVSNCIGSNIFDVLICLGLPWFFDVVFERRTIPLLINEDVSSISACLIASAFIVFCCLFITNWRVNKVLSTVFVFSYIGFVVFTSIFSSRTGSIPICPSSL